VTYETEKYNAFIDIPYDPMIETGNTNK